MANVPLKSITFPGLSDTYTVPQIDNTLTTSGKAADAKVVGDQLGDLKSAVTSLGEDVNGVILKNYTEGKNFTANSASHAIIDDENACISDYIPVTWDDNKIGFQYTDDSTDATVYQVWWFNSSKEYLSHAGRATTGTNARYNLSTPANAAFCRISFKKGYAGTVFLSSDASTIYYTAAQTVTEDGIVQKIGDLANLSTTEKTNLVDAINEVREDTPELPVKPTDTTFFHTSKNLINYADCVPNSYVNQNNGSFGTANSHYRTEYISVQPSTQYVVRERIGAFGNNFRYFFYKSDKTPIPDSGAMGALPDMVLTTPSNAAYIIISNPTFPQNMMIALYENGDKSFEAYDNVYVKPKYIVSGDAESIILNVPSKIYALVGTETNIYFENITEDYTIYDWDVVCAKGMQLERGYRITPVADDVGTYELTIRASLSENIYKEVTVSLIVTAATAGNGVTQSVIVLGDSTTNNGIVIEKLNDNFANDVMNITMLGTRGTAPNKHEGRSGWTLNSYFTVESVDYTDGRGHVENPFYNPTTQTFDAAYYFANSGIAQPDWFIINMGINDMFPSTSDPALQAQIETCIGYLQSMITSINEVSTSIKIGICVTIPPNHSQDAFGKAYNCGQTRNRYKRNNAIWANAIISEFDGEEENGIYVIPIHTNLDTVWNMGVETMPVNARNTSVTYESPIANGGVHPVESGYWQIADVYTAFLKAQASN